MKYKTIKVSIPVYNRIKEYAVRNNMTIQESACSLFGGRFCAGGVSVETESKVPSPDVRITSNSDAFGVVGGVVIGGLVSYGVYKVCDSVISDTNPHKKVVSFGCSLVSFIGTSIAFFYILRKL